MNKLRKVQDGVYYYDGRKGTKIGCHEITTIENDAKKNSKKRSRICIHGSNEDIIHEMIIAISRESYIQPHRHINKSESYHIIKGSMFIVIFDKSGKPKDSIALGGDSGYYYYRVPPEMYHTVIVETEIVVFHETTTGPLDPSKTVYLNPTKEENMQQYNMFKREVLLEFSYKSLKNKIMEN